MHIVHAREKAEDAEVAAALRELEKALTNYQDAEADVAQGELEKALKGNQEAEAPAAEAALRELFFGFGGLPEVMQLWEPDEVMELTDARDNFRQGCYFVHRYPPESLEALRVELEANFVEAKAATPARPGSQIGPARATQGARGSQIEPARAPQSDRLIGLEPARAEL